MSFFFFFFKILLIFRERAREGKREGEKHQRVVASCSPPSEHLAGTHTRAQTQNRTGGPLVRRPPLNPLSHTSQGRCLIFMKQLE